jgi:hypothetical protein
MGMGVVSLYHDGMLDARVRIQQPTAAKAQGLGIVLCLCDCNTKQASHGYNSTSAV